MRARFTVGIFGLSRRTCNFCALKRASFAQKLSYITYKATLNKIKHFSKKKISTKNTWGGPLPRFFEKNFFVRKCFLSHIIWRSFTHWFWISPYFVIKMVSWPWKMRNIYQKWTIPHKKGIFGKSITKHRCFRRKRWIPRTCRMV